MIAEVGVAVILVFFGAGASAGEEGKYRTRLLAREFLEHQQQLGLDQSQVERLEALAQRWEATHRALAPRASKDGYASVQEKADALFVWKELSSQRVLVDRDALFVLSPEQRQRWRGLHSQKTP